MLRVQLEVATTFWPQNVKGQGDNKTLLVTQARAVMA